MHGATHFFTSWKLHHTIHILLRLFLLQTKSFDNNLADYLLVLARIYYLYNYVSIFDVGCHALLFSIFLGIKYKMCESAAQHGFKHHQHGAFFNNWLTYFTLFTVSFQLISFHCFLLRTFLCVSHVLSLEFVSGLSFCSCSIGSP